MAKRVAVIGAGAAGLTSIKHALDTGFEPTAYEKDSWFGGIWYYTKDEHRFAAPKSTVFNTSKHFSCFSDFPFSKETPNYTPRHVFHQYLESYAEKFDLTRRIRFNREVLKVEKCKDYEKTGRWEIHSKTSDGSGKENVCIEEYDYVMVCSGTYSNPFVPKIAGIDAFTGTVIHSKSYKTYKPFEGRRVLVVGLGNTAGDIACELSRHSKQVYASTRRGTYVVPRVTAGKLPELKFLNRAVQCLPKSLLLWLLKRSVSSLYNLPELGLEPISDESLSLLFINDDLPNRIVTGTIIMKDEIVGFKDRRVFFKDHTELDDIDDVIFATGYDVCLPFLPDSLMNTDTAMSGHHSYKAVFPLGLSHPTLALIGICRVAGNGSVIPITEMQARFAMQVFTGEFILPSKELMKKEVVERRAALIKTGGQKASSSSYVLECFVKYLDDIGSLIGVKPNLWKLFFQDPKLAIKCFFGPAIPAQYRLMGPGAWSGAKDVIEGVEESRLAPLTTRKVYRTSRSSSRLFVCVVCSVVVLLIALLVF